MTKTKKLCGCISKDGNEIDGNEFECENLEDLIQILKNNKQVHLNYFEDESNDLDLWVSVE